MSKKRFARGITGGRMEIHYSDDDMHPGDNENSLAFKKELAEWQANPKVYWWKHHKNKVYKYGAISIIIISAFLILLFRR
jgi:hypothetical protein